MGLNPFLKGGNDLGGWSSCAYMFVPRLPADAVTGFAHTPPGGRDIPTNDMIAACEPDDLRKDASLKTSYTLKGKVVPVPYVVKYAYPRTIKGRTDNNWVILRCADVLMMAEAINEQTAPTSEAPGFVNQVRKRAGMKDLSGMDKATFKTAITQEQRVELAFENHRCDLR